MYLPAHFKMDDRAAALEFIRANSFAVLTSAIDSMPVATHGAMVIVADNGSNETLNGDELILFGHFAAANPHCEAVRQAQPMLAVFAGPHSYISPSWYTTTPAVPTWNYAAVHVSGQVQLIDDPQVLQERMRGLVSAHDNMPIDQFDTLMPVNYLEKMVRGIVGFDLRVERLDMKMKFSQNRSIGDRQSVIQALETDGQPEQIAVANIMREQLNERS